MERLASDGNECDRSLLSSLSKIGMEEHDGPLVLGEYVQVWFGGRLALEAILSHQRDLPSLTACGFTAAAIHVLSRAIKVLGEIQLTVQFTYMN